VWGDPDDKTEIEVDGSHFMVTRNLYDALKRLRKITQRRAIWADAICIDQRNQKEKGHQVKLMGNIYKMAAQVVMWLGEPILQWVDASEYPNLNTKYRELVRNHFTRNLGTESTNESHQDVRENDVENLVSRYLEREIRLGLFSHEIQDLIFKELPPAPEEKKDFWTQWLLSTNFGVDKLPLSTKLLDVPDKVLEIQKTISLLLKVELALLHSKTSSATTAQTFNWEDDQEIESNINDFFADAFDDYRQIHQQWPLSGAFIIVYHLAKDANVESSRFFSTSSTGHLCPSVLWNISIMCLKELLSTPYWQRVWTLQEAVAATRATIQCGAHAMPFELFAKAFQNLHANNTINRLRTTRGHISEWWQALVLFSTPISDILHIKESSTRTFDQLLFSVFQKRLATDPRDFVFGVLGMLDSEQKTSIPIDYSLSTGQVFSLASISHMEITKELCFYCDSEYHASKISELPSWSTDWSMPAFSGNELDLSTKSLCIGGFYKASFQFNQLPTLLPDLSLEVVAIPICRVVEVSKGIMSSVSFTSSPFKLKSILKDWYEFSARHEGFVLEDFLRVILGDKLDFVSSEKKGCRRITSDDIPKVQRWWEWFQERLDDSKDWTWDDFREDERYWEICDSFLWASFGRKLFWTSGKHLGLGRYSSDVQRDIRAGDEIYILPDCRVPLVLRPANSLQSSYSCDENALGTISSLHSSAEYYSLVGPCYVQGIMDGEGMEETFLKQCRVIYLR